MKLTERIYILSELGRYLAKETPEWQIVKKEATEVNPWFILPFIDQAVDNICSAFLDPEKLTAWSAQYRLEEENTTPRTVGLIMAGNIPLVGFQDFLSVFISGNRQKIKMSSKDNVLLKHLTEWLHDNFPETKEWIELSEMLKNCDAYIATGSDNSARYFEQYFAKYPHIIRRNRTSVAILDGSESREELNLLANDIQLYFGLGCRNVTQLYVPQSYDFVPLLETLRKYAYFMDHHKYLHNFDYNLTIQIMNNRYYMSNDSVLLIENASPFSPIGQIHYQFYEDKDKVTEALDSEKIQCIIGRGFTDFGKAQSPGLTDYADGVDPMKFLCGL
jgi:Acyl-CoA reductase (LuxC)